MAINNDMTYYADRILQNAFEDPELFEDDDDYYYSEGSGGAGFLFFIVPFFLIWNCAIGSHIVLGLSYLIRGKCHSSLVIFVCPHWLVGILVPGFLGYQWRGAVGCGIMLLVTVVVPYTFWFIGHARTNEELREHPICGCCISLFSSSSPGRISDSPGQGRQEQNNELEIKMEEPEDTPDSHLLIFKKVLPAEAIGKSSDAKGGNDVNHSFRFNHPKSDIYARPKASNSKNLSTASVQLCAICLEEYEAGEDIAWSRNPNCHHVYHKDCVLELLDGNHDECPICRESYVVFSDIELGGR